MGIHKKPKRRRRSSKIAKEKKSRLRRMFPLSSPSWGHSLLVLVLVLAAVVHAEDSYQPTTLPNISSREGGGTGAGVEEVADTSSGGGGPGGSGLPPRPLSSSANQQQQLKPCDRSRKVFTSPSGEISDGPTGTNYTQVKSLNETRCFLLNKIIKNFPNPTQKFYCYFCPTDDVVVDRQRRRRGAAAETHWQRAGSC